MKNLIRNILREGDWDFMDDHIPSPTETMNTVLDYEGEGDKYKVIEDIIHDGTITLWFYEFDTNLGEYSPVTYMELKKEEYQIDELLDLVIEKLGNIVHNNKVLARGSDLGPRTIGMLKIRKKEELLDTIKNVRTNILKEEEGLDWIRDVKPMGTLYDVILGALKGYYVVNEYDDDVEVRDKDEDSLYWYMDASHIKLPSSQLSSRALENLLNFVRMEIPGDTNPYYSEYLDIYNRIKDFVGELT